MLDAKELLYINLHDVSGERDPAVRRGAIERAYAEDVRFIDPEGEVSRGKMSSATRRRAPAR